MPSVLALLFALASASSSDSSEIPRSATPAAKLSTRGFVHHEVLRIDRDFGKPQWEIALDGWMPREREGGVEELRFWWVNTDEADHRKPFSPRLSRHIELGFDRRPDGGLDVRLIGDRKEYRFTVEVDQEGRPAVFAHVRLPDDTEVARCRCHSGRLIARRLVGIPIGIAALEVQCIDGDGRSHQGQVPFRDA